jgi:hypothetical protein
MEVTMKKRIFSAIVFSVIVFMLAFGCSKKNPSGPAATATNTPTMTAVPTSTAVVSPNLSGAVTVPSDANGKHFAVVVDNDTNTANGYVAKFDGIVNATSLPYAFLVTAGTYYVYAYVDMNNSGMTGPGGMDYFGNYGSWTAVVPTATAVDFNCTNQLDMTITMNITVPADCTGKYIYNMLMQGNSYDDFFDPKAGDAHAAPSGTTFTNTFKVPHADAGVYYLVVFIDKDSSCNKDCLPLEGDYLRIYGATGTVWPAAPNLLVNGDLTLTFSLDAVVPNVSGVMTLPGAANSNDYTIFASTAPMAPGGDEPFMITKTTQAGAGSTINYSIFIPVPGLHYIMGIVDMDDSGWNNTTGPVTMGDYGGLYGVTVPIHNFMASYPVAPNANLPGLGFNFDCDTIPDLASGPPATPTVIPTPSSAGGTGTISGTINIPAGQTGKTINLQVDMDLSPFTSNNVATFNFGPLSATHTSVSYSISGIPAGVSYYVYAGATTSGPPVAGDAVGIAGYTYPAFPASPNVAATSGGTTTANISMVVAANNVSGRVYMPAIPPMGSIWGVVIDTDMDGGNGGQIAMAIGVIGVGSPNYFDYSMTLALPGDYFIYAVVDAGAPYDLMTNGPGCGDFMGFYNFPLPVHLTPSGSNTNLNINATMGDAMLCP